MKMNAKVAEALNIQINNELHASYTYLAMAAYFEAQDLPGFAQWFRGHSAEEGEHAMRIFDFIAKRGGRIELDGISKPQTDYASPVEALEHALANEITVTGQINALFELAHEVKEYSTQNMLNWFLAEQIEEEDLFTSILDRVKAANGDRWNLLLLDQELGKRGSEE
ncbi:MULTISPECIES: ferritin [Alphaproteobacteria]|uniref:ferritin n=1 Tax=Alphaproteobacteria TaxID=28211 RepID=UPI0012BD1E13|nr:MULTISPECIES: ferritin [Alphaproteobacteria]MTI02131.1 ferritin [Roseibium sp. RKSG952]